MVIVGGGPAGSSAAHVLASAGVETCLLDAATFPRGKLCGGLLTLRSKKVFERIFHADWSPVVQALSGGANFFYRTRLLRRITDYKQLAFTCRKDFDSLLLNLARDSGARVLEGRRVVAVDPANAYVMLSDGERLGYDFLIGADGVNSLVARTLFDRPFNQRTIGFGLEMEVPIAERVLEAGKGGQPAAVAGQPVEIFPRQDAAQSGRQTANTRSSGLGRPGACGAIDAPEIYFGLIDWGYAWVFPKRTTLTAGIGGLWRRNPALMASFKDFLCLRFGCVPPAPIKGHYVPFGDYRPTPGRDRILLCGDAAGLVDPITGEGIAHAMQSGLLAAEAIRTALQTGQSTRVLDFYKESYGALASNLRHANALRSFLFPRMAQFVFAKVLARSEGLPKRFMDLMADDISYRDYRDSLLRSFFAALPKALGRHPAD